jgi:L-iditol 2-dehydrogenase/L-gulonate 5-dehydrogenase
MRAIVLHEPNRYSLEAVDDPIPEAGDAELRVRMVGICGTDLHVLKGHNPFVNYPLIPGHEYVGEVLNAPEDSQLKPGKRVVAYPSRGCGVCRACRDGRTIHCPKFEFVGVTRSGGGFAEKAVAPDSQLIPLPDTIADVDATLIEPLAVAVHAVRRAGIVKDTPQAPSVVVIGGGTIGLLIGQVARRFGAASVVLSEPLAGRRALASKMGIDALCNPAEEDLVEFVIGKLGMVDIVFDVVATAATFLTSQTVLRPGGCLVTVGLPSKSAAIPYEMLFKKELSAVASRTYFRDDFAEAIGLISRKEIAVAPLISAVLPLADFREGVRLLESEPGKYSKVLIDPAS